MFEIFWDAEVLGTFRALSKPSPPKHQVTLEQHRFASTLKWPYDDVICVDWKAWTRQSMPWSQDLKYTAIPVKLTFCWVLLFPYMFLVFSCCLRWKKNRQLKYPLMSSGLRFRVIGYFNSTQKITHRAGPNNSSWNTLMKSCELSQGWTVARFLERMSFSVTVAVFRNIGILWNTFNMKCSQVLRVPHVDKCWILQLVAIRQPCEKNWKRLHVDLKPEPSFVSKAESLGCDSRHVCLDLSVSRSSATTNYTFIIVRIYIYIATQLPHLKAFNSAAWALQVVGLFEIHCSEIRKVLATAWVFLLWADWNL